MGSGPDKTAGRSTSRRPATPRSSDSASIISICTTSIASIAPSRSKTRLARWPTSSAKARFATSVSPKRRRRRWAGHMPFIRSRRCRRSTPSGAATWRRRFCRPCASWGSASSPTARLVGAFSRVRSSGRRTLPRATGARTTHGFKARTFRGISIWCAGSRRLRARNDARRGSWRSPGCFTGARRSSLSPEPSIASMSKKTLAPSTWSCRTPTWRNSKMWGSPPGRAIPKEECGPSTADCGFAVGRRLQFGDVELLHLEQRLHHAVCLLGILVAHQLPEHRGHDLPGEPKLVFQPAAHAFFAAAGRELAPVLVDLLLILAVHDEGERLAELEQRAAVQRCEFLPSQLKVDDHHRAFGPGAGIAIPADVQHLGVLKDRHVELRGLLGLFVEPQEWRDLLASHRCLPLGKMVLGSLLDGRTTTRRQGLIIPA